MRDFWMMKLDGKCSGRPSTISSIRWMRAGTPMSSWSTARWWIPCWDSSFGFFIFVNDKLVTETFIIWLIFGIRLPNWGRIRNFWLLIFGARATNSLKNFVFSYLEDLDCLARADLTHDFDHVLALGLVGGVGWVRHSSCGRRWKYSLRISKQIDFAEH